ncbi:MAG: hypothetical protein EKK40_07000 [Bradyrhizobiaceae bacterium]|nr:MAG: hypothetical protein EKK40_07000 [Bradyrhizobiaceae bacterium]
MRTICDWRAVLKSSLSVRFALLSAIIIIAEPVVTYLTDLYEGPNIWIGVGLKTLAGLMALAGVYARIYPQDDLKTIVTSDKPKD